ncbi:MAG TPA: hypothetical protein VH022_14530 [Candidatus Acidoferrum sp.]|nr:hypothetical protein [Candidatus Acidoferrum sp.]
MLEKHLGEVGLYDYRIEFHFHEKPDPSPAPTIHGFDPYFPRDWRFDYAFPKLKLAIEIEGGIWKQGRHTRGAGFQRDLDKYNVAAAFGWTVFRFSVEDINRGKAVPILRAYLRSNSA